MITNRMRPKLIPVLAAPVVLLGIASPCLADDSDPLAEVTVTARRAVYAALGNQLIVDTPFTIFSVDSETVQQLQAKSITDVLQYQASATPVSSELSQAAEFDVRGFGTTTSNYFIDGLPATQNGSSFELPVEMFDNIQSVVGPVGFFYGFAPPAGIMTFQTKRPLETGPMFETDLGYRSNTLGLVGFDASRFNKSDTIGARVSGVFEDGTLTTGQLHSKRYALGADFDFKLTDQDKIEWDNLYYERHLIDPNYVWFVTYSGPVLPPVDARNDYAAIGNRYDQQLWGSLANYVHDFNNKWALTLGTSYFNVRTSPNDSELIPVDPQGDVVAGWVGQSFEDEITSAQVVVKGEFNTGPIGHLVNFGGTFFRDEDFAGVAPDGTTSFFFTGTNPQFFPPGLTNYFSNLYSGFTRADSTGVYRVTLHNAVPNFTNYQYSGFISDTLSWKDFKLILGGRYMHDKSESFYNGQAGGFYPEPNISTDSKATPTVALMYKPAHDQTAYVSYAEGYEGNQMADPTSLNAGQHFPARKSVQYEVGYKFENQYGNASIAAFDITRNGYQFFIFEGEAPYSVQSGTERHRGVEASAAVRLFDSLYILGGVQYLDAKISGVPPTQASPYPPEIPNWQGKMRLEYTIPGLEKTYVNASVLAYGPALALSVDQIPVPGYTLLGLGGRREFGCLGASTCTVRFDVQNLTDKSYWRAKSLGFVVGEAREYLVSLSARF
jgi:iron complex outermembrane recepter protein